MRTLVHLSDLHFGNADLAAVPFLVQAVRQLSPEIVAISGDLVQHAWAAEFVQAQEFLQALPGIHIVVAGNHDLSFYNPWRRAAERLRLYHHYITPEREPFYADQEIAVLGLNTARVVLLREGRINEGQVRRLEERMHQAAKGAIRVLVTHHPFDLPARYPPKHLVRHAKHVMRRVVGSVDLLLAGHVHVSSSGQTTERYRTVGRSAIFVQGGTALSHTQRGEPHSFHVVRLAPGGILVELWAWQSGRGAFVPQATAAFQRGADGWTGGPLAGVRTEDVDIFHDSAALKPGNAMMSPPETEKEDPAQRRNPDPDRQERQRGHS